MPNPKAIGLVESASFLGLFLSVVVFGIAHTKDWRGGQVISLLGVAASAGGLISSSLTHRNLRLWDHEITDLTHQLSERDRTILANETRISSLTHHLSELEALMATLRTAAPPAQEATIISQYKARLRSLHTEHQSALARVKAEVSSEKDAVIARLQAEMVSADTRIQEFEQRFVDRAQQTLTQALDTYHARMANLVQENLRKLDTSEPDEAFAQRLETLSEEISRLYPSYLNQILSLSEFLDQAGILDCSDEALSILYHLSDDYTNVKVKWVNALKTKAVRQLHGTIQAYQTAELVPKAQLEQVVENLKLRLQEYELEAAAHEEHAVAIANDFEAQTQEDDRIVRGYIDQLARLAHDNHQLKEQVAALSALKKFDPGAWGWGAAIGNEVIDYLMSEHIPCDALPLDFNPSDSQITIALNCRTEGGLRLLAKEGKAYEKGMAAAKGWKDVSMTLTGRVVKVTVQYANRAIAKVKPESVLERPLSEWELILATEQHWFIAAATQSGKTTLVDELDALLFQQYQGEVEFHAITLKTDGDRDAEKMGRFVSPRFQSSSKDYFAAQSQVLDEIESRKQTLAVNPAHRYKRSVYQWDEYGEHYRIGGMKEVTKMVLVSSLQVGAGLSSEVGKGIQITFMAQNPYVSQLGLFRPDLANCCLIIVGEKNIRLFLHSDEDNHGLDREDIERLKGELSQFKDASRKAVEKAQSEAEKQGEDPRIAIAKCRERYYSLIVPSKGGLKPIILYNPSPGQFTNALINPPVLDHETLPISVCEHDYKVLRSRKSKDGKMRQRELTCRKCGEKKKSVEPLE